MTGNQDSVKSTIPVSRRDALGIGTISACGLGLSQVARGNDDNRAEGLASKFAGLERQFNGEFSVEVNQLDGGGHFALRERAIRQTASTCKLFVLCELFRQAEAGKIDLNEPITWKPEFHRGGDGVLRAMVPGQQLSIHNMAVLMIIISDNIATATLVDRVGPANVNRTIRELGLVDSNLHQGLPGGPNARNMKQPVSSAHDLCSLITRIYRQEILSPKSCDEIIRILRAQRCNDMLPRFIPVGEDWGSAKTWIANKTGYGRCRVEVGIVSSAEAKFSLAMFFKPNQPPRNRLKCLADYPPVLAMARACEAVYQTFAQV
jgi:beta-lactamase class A